MKNAMPTQTQQGMLVIHHGQGEAMELVLLKLLLCTQVRVKFGYPYHLSKKPSEIFPRQFPPSKAMKR